MTTGQQDKLGGTETGNSKIPKTRECESVNMYHNTI
jgi:hypothetical protein